MSFSDLIVHGFTFIGAFCVGNWIGKALRDLFARKAPQ